MDKNNINIKEMTTEDLKQIKDILKEDFDDFWNASILKSELESFNSQYYVAKENNEIIGFAGFLVLIDSTEITNIVVKKNKRGNGISKLLLEQLINETSKLKKEKISLEVNENNTIAINLYKKYNFIKEGLRKKYYNGTDNALIMTKYLGCNNIGYNSQLL